ncbi:MAG TPA: proline dehydrogenase family protein [Ignavibacteriaceae bacterium]|nr:proline dehydrogenase family protein [Ignavibacteriaceae bacterium]
MHFLNKLIVSLVKLMPNSLVWIFSKRYIAGEKLEDAIVLVKSLNKNGIYATIDVLGEAIKNKDEALEDKKKCLEVLAAIKENNLMANLSIKPTQMGLGLDEDFAFKQVFELVDKAYSMNNFLRIDMEDSSHTDSTFRLFRRLKEKFNNVGVVVQAYLKRSFNDVVELNKINANYRLCKGIYIEPAEIAFKDRQMIRDNYLKVLKEIFIRGNYVGIATHDEYLINESYRLIKELNIPKDKFEFQMLLGVREDLRDKINADGYKIRIYVPFGKQWYKYSIRRLQENPEIAGHIVKNLFGIK